MNIQQALYDLMAPALDFWLLISLLTTMVVVQFFKAGLKHYATGKLDPFVITAIILIFAVITGYTLTRIFLEADAHRLAIAVALLNVAIYEGLLLYAKRKKWTGFEALLRMRRGAGTVHSTEGRHDGR